jgi:integrase
MLEDACAAGHSPGDPFTSRCHFMRRVCQRAGVKVFGFHALRHLSAVLLYKAGEPVAKI